MYKKILCFSALFFCLNNTVFADYDDLESYNTVIDTDPGIYLGVQAGSANLHYGSSYAAPAVAINNTKFGARACLGYSFSKFISLEAGYNYYKFPQFSATNGSVQKMLQYGIDLSAKATLPLDFGFAFYIKGGLEWIHRGSLHSYNGSFHQRDASSKIVPVGALGLNYWFTPNFALDLSWTKTITIKDLPTVDFFGAGFTYKFNF